MFAYAAIAALALSAAPGNLSDEQKADLRRLFPDPSAPGFEAKLDRLVVAASDFAKHEGRQFEPTDPNAWRVTKVDGRMVYDQFRGSKYNPPYRSPFNIALLKDASVEDFVFTAKVRSTTRDYGHRDACLFFDYQDDAHFYYVHLGKKADPNSNQIMIVNKAPRAKITRSGSDGTPWDDCWHTVKIVRRTADGAIEVYFDDLEKPCMTAVDKTFLWGRVGVGSFDDTTQWDDVRLLGVRHAP